MILAVAIVSQAVPYSATAVSTGRPLHGPERTESAVNEALWNAWGRVLCWAGFGCTGAGEGRLVPWRLVAAKLVTVAPTEEDKSRIDS